MVKISINLLPKEFALEEIKKARFYKIQAAGVAIILIMIFLASLTMALRILQSQNITRVQARLSAAEQQVNNLKDTQASLLLLKNRLSLIDQVLNSPSKEVLMYKLMDKLIPAQVIVNSVTIGKAGEVKFTAVVPDGQVLENLLVNLTTNEKNDNKIAQVSIETLNRSRGGLYRVNIKVKPK
ncbi:hypothetical protein HY384_01520 [Candidatus Daviesbacteria bacterium]|nr:hypothetical protein [Candidatus Daviesbacteria bacterium]